MAASIASTRCFGRTYQVSADWDTRPSPVQYRVDNGPWLTLPASTLNLDHPICAMAKVLLRSPEAMADMGLAVSSIERALDALDVQEVLRTPFGETP